MVRFAFPMCSGRTWVARSALSRRIREIWGFGGAGVQFSGACAHTKRDAVCRPAKPSQALPICTTHGARSVAYSILRFADLLRAATVDTRSAWARGAEYEFATFCR